jgi:hypothetical protein
VQPDLADPHILPLASSAGLLLLVLLAGLVSALGNFFRERLVPCGKGRLGEAAVNRRLRRSLDPRLYQLLPNVILPIPGGTTQIDHVLLSPFGIFVIETKTYAGWIYGGERDATWTQVLYRHKERFQNPLRQNYLHTQTLSEITGLLPEYFLSVVVFAGDAQLKTRMPPNVIYLRDLVRYLQSHQTPMMSPESVPDIVRTIEAARLRRHRLPANAIRTQSRPTPQSRAHRRKHGKPPPVPRPAPQMASLHANRIAGGRPAA